MLDLALSIGILAIIGTGWLLWKLASKGNAHAPAIPARRREDARDWQRRFSADSRCSDNFLQPTQNEILETLSVLDHLTPGWETGEQELIEGRFLHEMAVCFPTLRKAGCAFPQPFGETLPAKSGAMAGRDKRLVTAEEVAARREAFRLGRAQTHALEQIVAASVTPAEMTPGSLPFRISSDTPVARARNPWPVLVATLGIVIAALLGASYFHEGTPSLKRGPDLRGEPNTSRPTLATEPVQETPEIHKPVTVAFEPAAAATPTASQIPTVTPLPVAVSTPAPPVDATNEKAVLTAQIAASQQRAVAKYPALAVEGSEINLRFVFRYKNLARENSPRLRDPNWPEQLAGESAAASKQGELTRVTGARR